MLYTGINQRGLDVYTWVAETNVTTFDEDFKKGIACLCSYLFPDLYAMQCSQKV